MNQKQYNWPEMNLTPVGVFLSLLKTLTLRATKDNLKLKPLMEELKNQHKKIENTLSEILIFDSGNPLLKGIETFSHILVSAIELVRREINKLIVKGLEALDQSRVIDIKPYNINYMKKEGLRFPEWMQKINTVLAI